MKEITTIFFDLDDTLLNHTGAEVEGIMVIKKRYFPKVNQQTFMEVWLETVKYFWKRFERNELSFEEQRTKRIEAIWEHFGKIITISEAKQFFIEYLIAYEQAWETFPSVIEILTFIQHKGIKLGILSNGEKKQQIQKLQAINIYQFINPELLIFSDEAGFAKPDQRIFKFAQDIAGVLPANILFIGDNPLTDIEPARKVGWNVLLIDYFNRYPENKSFKNFEELRAYLANL